MTEERITFPDDFPVPYKPVEPVVIQIDKDTAITLEKSVTQLQAVVPVLVSELRKIQERMAVLEAREKQVTLSHEEVKTIQQLIRNRSYEYCEKYGMLSPGPLRSVSAGIKKAVLHRYGVKDLHDVPAIARQAVEAQISRWADSRLAQKWLERLSAGG